MRWWNFNPKIKYYAAELSHLVYSIDRPPIVVASTGRSGSTMLCHSIMNSYFFAKYKTRIKPRFVFYPAFAKKPVKYFKKGGVYKTHLLSKSIPLTVKTIFIYDDPVISYKSFSYSIKKYGTEWGKQHLKNLESEFDILNVDNNTDFLNFENQVTGWVNRASGLVIRFSHLWDFREELSGYIGVNLRLPRLRKRESEVSDYEKLPEIMKDLKSIYFKAPKFQVR